MLRIIRSDGVCRSVSIDPIPESWEPQEQPQQQHQQESAIVPLWSAAPAAATAAAPAAAINDTSSSSIASEGWKPLPSFQCLLDDSGDEGPVLHTPAKRSSGYFNMVGESPPLQLTPTFSPNPKDGFPSSSGGELQVAFACPPLDASHHGVTNSARPPKKQKGQGNGKGKGNTSSSDKKGNGNSKDKDSDYKYNVHITMYP